MSPSEDFYALVSSLLQQTAQNPDKLPVIPLKRWPAGSPEQFLLEDLQAALAALQTCNQNHPPQDKGSEQQYQSIFEIASVGLIINDLEIGIVVEANPAAYTMFGYARNEFIGLHPISFIHPGGSGGVGRAESLHPKEMRGQVKEWWGKLTDDDLEQAGGNAEQIVGLLQQKYCYTRHRDEEEFNQRIKEVKEAVDKA